MNSAENASRPTLSLQKLKAHRLLLLAAPPACFVLLFAIMCCIPRSYKSTFMVSRESEQAVEVNRAITLNQPENFDLGLGRTDNAVHQEGYLEMVHSDGLLYQMLDMPVQTLNGSFSGTCFDYLTFAQKAPFWERAIRALRPVDANATLRSDTAAHWFTHAEIDAIRTLREAISCEMDYDSKIVTISVSAQDPMSATMLARNLNDVLYRTIDTYEIDKMNGILQQLSARADKAEADYEEALTAHSVDADRRKAVAESLRRQQLVYEAQMLHHPAYFTLSQPSIEYKHAGPSRWKMPLAMTILLMLCMVGWIYRKEVVDYIMR